MSEISLLSGIYTNKAADYRQSYPVNYYPVVLGTGVSKGYLRQSPGISMFGNGVGVERGSIVFQGQLYKVSGSDLIRVYANGIVESLANIPGSKKVSMAKSFDKICIVADGKAFYWSVSDGLQQITDPDFGTANDVIYVDSYFLFVDTQFIFNSSISDPMAIDPLSFGSAEVEGDPIVGIIKIRNEPYVCGTETIEVFQNVGGSGFPFQRVDGAMITKGVVGTHAMVEAEDNLFFVGAGSGEAPSVYLAGGGQASKIASDEVEKIVQSYNDAQLADISCDTYTANGQFFIMINLPNETVIYDLYGSRAAGIPLWHIRKSGDSSYRARGFQRVYGKWIVGDSQDGRIGELRDDLPTEYGEVVFREFTTPIGFVEGRSFIVHEAKLYGIPANTAIGTNPKVSMSKTENGRTYSQERWAASGKTGDYNYTPIWRQCGRASSQLVMKFRVANASFYTPARLEVQVEVLNA